MPPTARRCSAAAWRATSSTTRPTASARISATSTAARPARSRATAYSKGLADADFVWDEATLDPWLADPRGYIPGTKMVLKLAKPEDRADVIAYLKSLNGQ